MRMIHQFAILGSVSKLWIPERAKILSVQMHGYIPVMWVEWITEDPKIERTFKVYETGSELPFCEIDTYIGTYQDRGKVWHLYEVNPSN